MLWQEMERSESWRYLTIARASKKHEQKVPYWLEQHIILLPCAMFYQDIHCWAAATCIRGWVWTVLVEDDWVFSDWDGDRNLVLFIIYNWRNAYLKAMSRDRSARQVKVVVYVCARKSRQAGRQRIVVVGVFGNSFCHFLSHSPINPQALMMMIVDAPFLKSSLLFPSARQQQVVCVCVWEVTVKSANWKGDE